MNPKFSIITVSFNTLNDFKNTLNSITEQIFKNFELIVVDGNSSDGTIDEIRKNEEHISQYIIEEDEGIYDAMNKGINFANSEWIIFLNSGDTFFNKNVLIEIDKIDLINYEIVYGKTIINNHNVRYSDNPKKINSNFISMPFCHQSSLVRTDLMKKKFDLKYKVSSDFDFFLKCYRENRNFLFTNSYIASVKSGGLSDKNRQLVFNENIKILKNNNLNSRVSLLYFFKIKEYFLSYIKKIIPKTILIKLIRLKNKNNLIEK